MALRGYVERYGTVEIYEEGLAGYWHRRYDEQHRTLHDLEDELGDLRRRYDELSAQTGQAITRAHVMRGDRELDAAKLREQLEELREAAEAVVALWSESPWSYGSARRAMRRLNAALTTR